MRNDLTPIISGVGIVSGFGAGKANAIAAMREAKSAFAPLNRAGRQIDSEGLWGIEIPSDHIDSINQSLGTGYNCSLGLSLALHALDEAYREANLEMLDGSQIGLIVGGSNLQQRELVNNLERYQRSGIVLPMHAMSYMDTDISSACCARYNISGLSYTLGGASSSGLLAVLHAVEAVQSGKVDVCIAIGAVADLSKLECAAFRNIGAMGGAEVTGMTADTAYRPFDKLTQGFYYGESCAAIVVERHDLRSKQDSNPYARVLGHATVIEPNRSPDPSFEAECLVMNKVMQSAQLTPCQIDYVNPHGSGSALGDKVELEALLASGLNEAYINTTKSIFGHGLSSAGAIEMAAMLLQMRHGFVHPSRNLYAPIRNDFNWVKSEPIERKITTGINLSYGFGGFNSAICLQNMETLECVK